MIRSFRRLCIWPLMVAFLAVLATPKLLARSVVAVAPTTGRATCPTTALEDRLPSVIAPMAGRDPVWLVDGSFGAWGGSGMRVKSVLVLPSQVSGDLTLRGQRLDGPGVMEFQRGVNEPISDVLVLSEQHRWSLIPGGATEDIMQRYTFVPAYLIYPSPGCWEIVARVGNHNIAIVVNLEGDRGQD